MAEKEFARVYLAGRRRAFLLGFPRKRRFLLSLSELTEAVSPIGESYVGLQEIPVNKIIGTENRGTDFASSFLPVRKSMEKRWVRVRDLLLGPGIPEPLKVIEYGGFYFVRDGNHRVSVAKSHQIDFFDAHVTKYEIPVQLPVNMNRTKIALFRAKAEFQRRTRFFDFVTERSLGEAHPETWQLLADSIMPQYRERFERRHGRPAARGELEAFFYEGALNPTMVTVETQALPTLFRSRYVLDIACQLLKAYEGGFGRLTPAEAFSKFLEDHRRKLFVRRIVHGVLMRLKRLTATASEERDVFLRMTRLRRFRPNARIAEGGKDWYRFLTRQVVVTYSGVHANETGSHALIDELVCAWYDRLYAPAFKLYSKRDIALPFPVFYIRWMKHWRRQAIRKIRKSGYVPRLTLRQSFEDFVDTL